MKTAVKIGEYKLLDSITIIGIDKQPIEIQIGEENPEANERALTFVFSFKNDEENKEQRIEYRLESETRGNIELINMNNFIGGGNTEVIKIGKYRGHELLYSFRLFTLKKGGNTLIVNFYKGKEVDNG